VNEYRLQYINPPRPFWTEPAAADAERHPGVATGTCIDLALLLASCLEYIDIYPVVVLLEGHAFAGYWRSEEATAFVQVQHVPAEVPAVGAARAIGGQKFVDQYGWRLTRLHYDEIMDTSRPGTWSCSEATYLTSASSFSDAVDERANLRSRRELDSLLDIGLARSATPRSRRRSSTTDEDEMPSYEPDDPERFLSYVAAGRREDGCSAISTSRSTPTTAASGLRRRRRATNDLESVVKTSRSSKRTDAYGATGYRRDPPPAAAADAAAWTQPATDRSCSPGIPTLAPNKIIAAVGVIDRRLNTAIAASLQSRLRRLQQTADGAFTLQARDVAGPFSGRTLLFVHGTCANADGMLAEWTMPGGRGIRFLNRAIKGARKYDRVLFFDHPTLSVSPVINALELGRAMAGSTGQIDVVAHSRGGLVVRWWLEAFGSSLSLAGGTRVRAVLAGSPLHLLAAPDRIQHAMSCSTRHVRRAHAGAGRPGEPFLWVTGKLLEAIVGDGAREDAAGRRSPRSCPALPDSRQNNLRSTVCHPVAADPAYYAIMSNFETQNPRWRSGNFRRQAHVAPTSSFRRQRFGGGYGRRHSRAPPAAAVMTSGRRTLSACNYFRRQVGQLRRIRFGVTLE
jgi:hypothetical protein